MKLVAIPTIVIIRTILGFAGQLREHSFGVFALADNVPDLAFDHTVCCDIAVVFVSVHKGLDLRSDRHLNGGHVEAFGWVVPSAPILVELHKGDWCLFGAFGFFLLPLA